MCLSVQSGGGFEAREAPRRSPGVDEIEIAVEAASVNPIDVRRADGYGRRRLSLLAASRLPMTLGNSFAGTVVAAGKGCEGVPAVGDRVYGVKPISRDGSHASHLLPNGRLRAESAAGPKHSGPRGAAVFLRDDLARREGSRVNSRQHLGKTVLVHGAAPSRRSSKKRRMRAGLRRGRGVARGFCSSRKREALTEMARLVELRRLHLPTGIEAPSATSMPPLITLDVAGLDARL